MSQHEMLDSEGPTFCKHCGTFDDYCGDEPCPKFGSFEFDFRDPAKHEAALTSLLGEGWKESMAEAITEMAKTKEAIRDN